MKAVQPVIASDGVPYLQITLVVLYMSGKEKVGKNGKGHAFLIVWYIDFSTHLWKDRI